MDFKDLVGFIKQFMNRAAFHLTGRGVSKALYQIEGSYRRWGKKFGKRKILFQTRPLSFTGKARCLVMRITSSSFWGMERAPVADSLTLIEKFLTDWLRLPFQGRLKLQ